jgi:PPIC-type PPIASE domain
VIEVSEGRIDSMIETFTRQWTRPPSPNELDGLVVGYVREEALAREAMALGLDRDDTIIRRRLAQKIEFVIGDLEAPPTPDDPVLREWFEANQDRYRHGGRITFEQVSFDPSRQADKLESNVAETLSRLNSLDPPAAETLGELRMFEPRYEALTTEDVKAMFGDEFAQQLARLTLAAWAGPIESGAGIHLVKVVERTDGDVRPFAELRERVIRDYQAEWLQRRTEERIDEIVAKYEVRLDPVLSREPAAEARNP